MAVDGNHIDAMFVDMRDNRSSGNGQKLVCVCGGGYVHMYILYLCGWVGLDTFEKYFIVRSCQINVTIGFVSHVLVFE